MHAFCLVGDVVVGDGDLKKSEAGPLETLGFGGKPGMQGTSGASLSRNSRGAEGLKWTWARGKGEEGVVGEEARDLGKITHG